jgi:hypothetical protein
MVEYVWCLLHLNILSLDFTSALLLLSFCSGQHFHRGGAAGFLLYLHSAAKPPAVRANDLAGVVPWLPCTKRCQVLPSVAKCCWESALLGETWRKHGETCLFLFSHLFPISSQPAKPLRAWLCFVGCRYTTFQCSPSLDNTIPCGSKFAFLDQRICIAAWQCVCCRWGPHGWQASSFLAGKIT